MTTRELMSAVDSSLHIVGSAPTANPFLPPLYDLVWTATAIALIAMIVLALVSVTRHTDGLSTTATAVWAAIVVFAAFVGPIAWFVVGRPAARASRLTSAGRAG
ncbi:MAG: PLD nuclease N-terminal domain-containing protein [Cryobacterium sp.]|nr:PLD nuclease N-terminal domain-containing protein [Cryobacterium sp.]